MDTYLDAYQFAGVTGLTPKNLQGLVRRGLIKGVLRTRAGSLLYPVAVVKEGGIKTSAGHEIIRFPCVRAAVAESAGKPAPDGAYPHPSLSKEPFISMGEFVWGTGIGRGRLCAAMDSYEIFGYRRDKHHRRECPLSSVDRYLAGERPSKAERDGMRAQEEQALSQPPTGWRARW
jgi:hypothetical protein